MYIRVKDGEVCRKVCLSGASLNELSIMIEKKFVGGSFKDIYWQPTDGERLLVDGEDIFRQICRQNMGDSHSVQSGVFLLVRRETKITEPSNQPAETLTGNLPHTVHSVPNFLLLQKSDYKSGFESSKQMTESESIFSSREMITLSSGTEKIVDDSSSEELCDQSSSISLEKESRKGEAVSKTQEIEGLFPGLSKPGSNQFFGLSLSSGPLTKQRLPGRAHSFYTSPCFLSEKQKSSNKIRNERETKNKLSMKQKANECMN